jgi:hypothetical protein
LASETKIVSFGNNANYKKNIITWKDLTLYTVYVLTDQFALSLKNLNLQRSP